MRWTYLIGAMAALLAGLEPARGDEPGRKLQVVTPKGDGIVATGINQRGDLIGFEWIESKTFPGVLDQVPFIARGKQVVYLPLLTGYTATFPAALSDDGVVVGRAGKPAPEGVRIPLRNQAFIWDSRAGIRGLGVLEGDQASFASDISADGRRISGFSVGDNRVRACVWDRDGDRWKISALPHAKQLGNNMVALSDDGKRAAAVDGDRACLWTEESPGQWKQERIGESGSLVPRAVNNAGLVAGVRFTFDGLTHAVIWTREKGVVVLEKPPGYVKSEANAVNNHGVVVGMIDGPGGSDIGPNAFAYQDGRLRKIEEAGPYFASATAINDKGQVGGVFEKEEDEAAAAKPAERKEPSR